MYHKELKFDFRALPKLHSSATMSIVLASVSWGRLPHKYSLANVSLPTYKEAIIQTAANAFPVSYTIHGIQFTDQRMNLEVILLSTLTTKYFR